MKKINLLLTLLIFFAFCKEGIYAQNNVSVNPANVLNDVSSKPFGINMNTFTDDDANRPAGARPLRTALTDLGAKFLRFPGGEKSDLYMWSKPPYNDPRTASLARDNANLDWPAADARIWNASAKTWANNNYDFDEFMADCRAVGGEPVIVVAMDGIYKAPFSGSNSLTYDQALEMAWKWVYYANVVKGYNVKYWSIGNETYLDSYAGSKPSYTQYGIDVKAFAQAMKNVDPTIKIGINGGSTSNFNLALAQCASYIDFLDIHTYPCYGFTNYSNYETNNIRPTSIVNAAQNAINALPNASDRNRIFIAMTEISSLGYASGSWDNGNAVNHGLASFDLLAQLANDSRVKFTQYWNTRWVNNNDVTPKPEDALNKNNDLNASGAAISLLFKNVHDKMVGTTSTTSVKTFASYNSTTKALTVFLLNKSQSASATNLSIPNYNANSSVERWVYKGTGVTDINPKYTQQSGISTNNNAINLTLDPASITVLKLTASTAVSCSGTGSILLERYNGISGTTISKLTSASKYPSSPDFTATPTLFEAPSNIADNYGLRMRGYICPPTTGSYTFWIAGDDNVELWLSTNNSVNNKTRIAFHNSWTASRDWNKFSTQKSAAITLQAGTNYYIEALMKEGGGGDNLAVGWAKPGQATTSPSEVIPGTALIPATGTTVVNTCGSVINSSFESDLSGWTGATAAISTSANTGNKAAVLGTADGGMSYSTYITAAPGSSIAFDVYAKVEGGPSWAGVGIDYLNASDVKISQQMFQITTTGYTKYSVTGTAPANTAKILIWAWKSGTVGKLYIDDVCLRINEAAGMGEAEITSENVEVYPNPAKEDVTIVFDLTNNGPATVSLYDQFSKMHIEKKYEAEAGVNRIKLPLENLDAGLYFIKINSRNGSIIKRIMVTK